MSPSRDRLLLFVAGCLFLSGCIGVDAQPMPTQTASPVAPSPTVAFPTLLPTSTFTPLPTGTATPDLSSSPGNTFFADRFSGDLTWAQAALAPGGLSLAQGRLVISVRQANSLYMAISPADPVPNTYLEVDVRPEICLDNDEFGLAFRINEDFEHYRFTLTCDGQARVVGVVEGVERILIPSTDSDAIFPGLFLTNRLGVQMEDDQFRFYINGEELFSDRDLSLPSGRFGLVVRARQSGQTTASFDNFSIRLLQPPTTNTPSD